MSELTLDQKANVAVTRDLCLYTGAELAERYTTDVQKDMLVTMSGLTLEDLASHNPFWFYMLQTWYSAKSGYREYLGAEHRRLADAYLDLSMGLLDDLAGLFNSFPRRGLKSTEIMAFADWSPKRHKYVEGLDVFILYSHNSAREAENRMNVVKELAQNDTFVARHFTVSGMNFVIPIGEWGNREQWNWPCRDPRNRRPEKSITAMSAGAKKAGRGYNYRLLDDWEEEGARDSVEIRETNKLAYAQQRKLKSPPFSREAMCGTPYAMDSLYKPMTRFDDYRVVLKPAMNKEWTVTNFPTIPDLSVKALMKERDLEIRATGSDRFWRTQFQLEYEDLGDVAMKWEYFQRMTPAEFSSRYAKMAGLRVAFCDPAWKGEEEQVEGSDTAIGIIDIYQIGDFYDYVLHDGDLSNQWDSWEGHEVMLDLMEKYRTNKFSEEQTADKPAWGIMRGMGRQRRPPIHARFIDLKSWTKQKKARRISAVAGAASMGHWYVLTTCNSRLTDALRDQADTYPHTRGNKKDVLDMMANAHSEEVRRRVPVGVAPMDYAQEEAYVFNEGRQITRYTNVRVPA